eukprot:UN21020
MNYESFDFPSISLRFLSIILSMIPYFTASSGIHIKITLSFFFNFSSGWAVCRT